jgi:hypothetical protein
MSVAARLKTLGVFELVFEQTAALQLVLKPRRPDAQRHSVA